MVFRMTLSSFLFKCPRNLKKELLNRSKKIAVTCSIFCLGNGLIPAPWRDYALWSSFWLNIMLSIDWHRCLVRCQDSGNNGVTHFFEQSTKTSLSSLLSLERTLASGTLMKFFLFKFLGLFSSPLFLCQQSIGGLPVLRSFRWEDKNQLWQAVANCNDVVQPLIASVVQILRSQNLTVGSS